MRTSNHIRLFEDAGEVAASSKPASPELKARAPGSVRPDWRKPPTVFDAVAPTREITRSSGRVYQIRPDQCDVAIDWIPSAPILGCALLIGGRALNHPFEGKIVRFPQAIRRRRGTTSIAVRTGDRPELLELFELAKRMEAMLRSEIPTTR
jgi:hypothetical protein